MARAKGIYILMVEVNKFIFFFASQYFLKEVENMFFDRNMVHVFYFLNNIHCKGKRQTFSMLSIDFIIGS